MEIIDEYTEVRRKYWKREPKLLASGRICTLCIGTIAVLGYLAILIVFIARSNTIVVKSVIPTDIVPVPDLSLSLNYKFNVSCQFRHLDGSLQSQDICAQYLTQPCNKSDDGRYYGYFTALDNLNYSLSDGRYGVWFSFFLDDTAYDAQNDMGMFARAYDSEFDPRTLEPKIERLVRRIDPNFFNRLDEANAYVVGAKQNNWMFITRTIKKKMKSTFGGWLGIPPSYYKWPFLQSRFESVADPTTVFATVQQNPQVVYGHLFVGTLDWYTEENMEIRTRNVLDGLALISGFYLLVVGIYICLFGASPILPWGLCQSFCMRKKVKENVKSQYPKYIPLVDPIDSSVRTKQRLQYLEKFLRDYVIDVDVLQEYDEDEDKDNSGLTPDEKNEIDTEGGGGVYNPDDIQFGEVPPRRTRTDTFRESDDNLINDDEEEFNVNKSAKPSKFSAIQAGIAGFAGAGFALFKSKKDKTSTDEIEATQYENTKTEKESETIITGLGMGGGSSQEKNNGTFVASGENPTNFGVIAGSDVPSKKKSSDKLFGIFGKKGKKSSAAGGVVATSAIGVAGVAGRRKRRGSGSSSSSSSSSSSDDDHRHSTSTSVEKRTSKVEVVEVVRDDSNPGVETIITTETEEDVIETTTTTTED